MKWFWAMLIGQKVQSFEDSFVISNISEPYTFSQPFNRLNSHLTRFSNKLVRWFTHQAQTGLRLLSVFTASQLSACCLYVLHLV